MATTNLKTYYSVLVIQGEEVSSFQVIGVFENNQEAVEYAEEELDHTTPYEVRSARYY